MITRFELSRIYAEGWNAANALTMDQREELMAGGGIAGLNPWPPAKKRAAAHLMRGYPEEALDRSAMRTVRRQGHQVVVAAHRQHTAPRVLTNRAERSIALNGRVPARSGAA